MGLIVIALKLALIPVVFDPLGESAFGVAKSAASRAGMYLLLSIGLALFVLSPDARRRLLRLRAIGAGLLAFGAIAALSTLLAVDRGAALFGVHHRYLGLTSIADGLVLASVLPLFVVRQADLRWVYGGLFGGAAAVIGYAAVQHVHLDPFSWEVPLTSSLGNRGVYAGFLVVIAAAGTCAGLINARSRWALLGLGLISLAATVLAVRSGVRGAILALPPALLFSGVMAFLAGWRPRILHRRAGIAAAALLSLLALLAGVSVAGPRLATLLTGGDTSLAERTVVYEAAFRMIAARPLVGAGPDNFAVLYPPVRPAAAAELSNAVALGQSSAHSWPLHHAVGTGLLGIASLALLVTVSIRTSLADGLGAGDRAQKIGGVVIVAFLFQGLFEIPDVGTEYLFWTGIGLTAVGALPSSDEVTGPSNWRRSSIAAGLIAVALGLVSATTTVNWHEANRAVRASDALRSAGKLEVAEAAALVATQRDPGRANNWNVLGLARSPTSPDRALAAFERASAAAPYDSRYLINLVKDEARVGETDPSFLQRARTHAQRAVEIDPRNAETRMVLSFALLKTADPAGARREADLAITLAPKDPQYYSWSATIHEDTGDFVTAVARYEAALAIAGQSTTDSGVRARLARLFLRAGMPERAGSIARPRLLTTSTTCREHCYQVTLTFDTPFGLALDGPGSALDLERYRIDGARLPKETTVSASVGLIVSIVGLPIYDLFRPGSSLTISGLMDNSGLVIDPDPTVVAIR